MGSVTRRRAKINPLALDCRVRTVLSLPRTGTEANKEVRMRQSRRRPLVLTLILVIAVSAVWATYAAASASRSSATKVKVGLITKDVTNPFFVKMRQGATAQAKKLGAELVYAAGKNSSDNASQIAAIENMTTSGVKGILIAAFSAFASATGPTNV